MLLTVHVLLVCFNIVRANDGNSSKKESKDVQKGDFWFGSSITEFGKDLMSAILKKKGGDENVVMNAHTIHQLMTMLYFGSPDDSDTSKQLAKALHFGPGKNVGEALQLLGKKYKQHKKQEEEKGTVLKLATRIFVKDSVTVKKGFLDEIKKNTVTQAVESFKTPDEGMSLVNDWSEEKTNGMIKKMIQKGDVTKDTMMILASACYFKSDWKYQFKKNDTKPMKFIQANGKEIEIAKGMLQNNLKVKAARMDDFEVVELPYEDKHYFMYIALPTDNGIKALNKVASEFSLKKFKDDLIQTTYRKFQMPSFDATSELDLYEPLTTMGLQDLFGSKADFSKMTDMKLSVGKVKTKTVVKVDEKGSEAAAVATATMMQRSAPPSLIVDRPFVFMIYDDTIEAPLFIGRIVNPEIA